MFRWILAVAGLGLAAGPGLLAQQGTPGYLIIRVNLDTQGGQPAAGGMPGMGGMQPGSGGMQPGPGGMRPGGMQPGPGGMRPGGMPGPGGLPGQGGFQPGGLGGQTGQNQQIDPAKSVAVVVPYKYIVARRVPPSWPFVLHGEGGISTFLYASKGYVQLYPLDSRVYPNLTNRMEAKRRNWERARKPAQGGFDLVVEALSYGLVDQAWQYADDTAKLVEASKENKEIAVPATVASFAKAFNEVKGQVAAPVPDTGDAARWQTTLGAHAVDQKHHYALVHWGDSSVSREGVSRRLDSLESNFKAFYLWHALGGVALKAPDRKQVVVLADKASDMPRLRDTLDGKPIVSDAFYTPTHNLIVLAPERMDDAGRAFSRFVQSKYQVGWNREELLKGKVPNLKQGETLASAAEMMTLALVDKTVEEELITSQVTREGSRQLFAASGVISQHLVPPEWTEHGAANLLNKPKGPHYWSDNRGPYMTVGLASGYGSPNYILVRQYRDFLNKKELNPDAEELLMNTLMDRYFDAARDGKDIDPSPQQQKQDGVQIGGAGAAGQPGGAPGFGGGFGRPGGGQPGFGRPGGGFPGAPGSPGEGDPEGGPGFGGGFGQPGFGGFGGNPNQPDPEAEARNLKLKLERKAQVTAWALTFYLAKKKMPALLAYYAELNQMPRDMRLDRTQVLHTFCRVMGLMDTNNPTEINKTEFKRFAEDWVGFLRVYSSWGIDLQVDTTADPGSGGINPGGNLDPSGGMGGPMGGGPGSPDG